MALTPAPGNQRMKDTLNIDAVGLHPPRPPVGLQAGRLHHLASDIPLLKEPRQPKPVMAGLVALPPASDPYPWPRAAALHRASPSDLRHQT